LLGMRCRGKSEGKDNYREDQLLHVMHSFCPFRMMCCDNRLYIAGLLIDTILQNLNGDFIARYNVFSLLRIYR
jgi:hypothetical protein